ncbi:MAG: hypothetical protein R3C18_20255 [Planctomycetaceae bacterium]
MTIKDRFEISNRLCADHENGLVAVLSERLSLPLDELWGRQVEVFHFGKSIALLVIAEAKDHGKATSLFFRNVGCHDIPEECELRIK